MDAESSGFEVSEQMAERIWISWTQQRRNEGIASGIGAKLYIFSYEKYKFFRYPLSVISTLCTLVKERPQICCAMLPSIFCAALLALVKCIFKYKLIIDLHTLNVYYVLGDGRRRTLYDHLLQYSLHKGDLIIVSNDHYAREIGQLIQKIFSLPDRIPENTRLSGVTDDSRDGRRVLCICSYDPDEPYEELFTAASNMADIDFFFSGNFRVLEKTGKKLPDHPNIHFTGFLPSQEYEQLLCLANVVVVATELEGCLCCGAYEALAAGKPLVLSSTQALIGYFEKGPIYTQNNAKDIEKAIRLALEKQEEFAALIRIRAEELKGDWELKISKLNTLLREMIS